MQKRSRGRTKAQETGQLVVLGRHGSKLAPKVRLLALGLAKTSLGLTKTSTGLASLGLQLGGLGLGLGLGLIGLLGQSVRIQNTLNSFQFLQRGRLERIVGVVGRHDCCESRRI